MLICDCCANNDSFTAKDWIPIVSPILVLLLFVIDRILGNSQRRKEIERGWYLNVLVYPNLPKIAEFYKKSESYYSTSAVLLNANQNIGHIEYLTLKSEQFGAFQTIKRDFEINAILPIEVTYPKLGTDLTSMLLDLEDLFTSSLDNSLFSPEEIKEIQRSIAQNASLFLASLFIPLRNLR